MLKDNFLQYRPNHAWHWWAIKVVCGMALIGGLFVRYLGGGFEEIWAVPVIFAQIITIVGGALYCWHYLILRSGNTDMSAPKTLINKGGLYSVIRHPMYFADAVCYTGLALFWLNGLSMLVLITAYLALFMQAREEDGYIAKLFPERYSDWAARTRLLVPLIF